MATQARARILIVDDERVHRFMLRSLFEEWGWLGEEADDGATAVAAVEQGPFDAILMDVRMPQMDGLTATQSIRHWNKEDARSIPIIAMTANAFDEDVRDCFASGMNAHVAKPIDPDNLFAAIASLTNK